MVYHTADTITADLAIRRIISGQLARNTNNQKAPSTLSNETFWITIALENKSDQTETYFLNFTFNRTDVLSFYSWDQESDSAEFLYQTGDVFSFENRPLEYRSFIFPITMEGNQTSVFLLNADKRGTVDRFPIRVFPANRFDRIKNAENLRFGLFFGIFIVIIIGSLVFGIVLNRRVFFFYAAYAALIGLYLFASLGLMFQWLTPNWPEFNNYNLVVIGSWAIVFFSYYSRYIFKRFGVVRWLDLLQLYVTYLLILVVNIPFIFSIWKTPITNWILNNYMIVLTGNYLGVLLIFLLAFTRAFYFLKQAKWQAGLFIIGILFSFAGIIYSILVDNGVFHDFIFEDNSNAVLAGFLIEMGFLSATMLIYLRQNPIQKFWSGDEMRIREMHHRVKNNLQVISSLMNLQAMQLGDESIQRIVQDGQKRIQAMSLVHQKLYQQENSQALDIKEYLETLIDDIQKIYNASNHVRFNMAIQQIALDVESITSIGLIVNELIINSFKYAFEGVRSPEILVLFKDEGDHFILEIGDNGVGIKSLQEANTSAFGLKLVELLIKQLKAELQIDKSFGLRYRLTFNR